MGVMRPADLQLDNNLIATEVSSGNPTSRSRRLLARTLPFQGGKDGSKPFGSTNPLMSPCKLGETLSVGKNCSLIPTSLFFPT
jgi:hypothetical protein